MSKKKEMTVKMVTGIVDKWTREQASLYRDSIYWPRLDLLLCGNYMDEVAERVITKPDRLQCL